MSIEIALIFRKKRKHGNFSIETSFDQLIKSFQSEKEYRLNKHELSFFSTGLPNRIKILIETIRIKSDIYHITGDVHFTAFVLPSSRTILTIHDCGIINNRKGIKSKLLKWIWLDIPVKKCSYITAVSNATKNDIIKLTGCDPRKIYIIPTLIKDIFSYDSKPFNKKKPVILHIGTAYNKNLENHIKALNGFNCTLVILGFIDLEYINLLKNNNIDYINYDNVTDEQLVKIYKESDLLLFCSTLEGFGMPIIEAQTIGRVVVTSNISSMPEIGGEGAVYADPYNVASIRSAILKVINDDDFRNKKIKAGLQNIKRFSVTSVKKKYLNLYSSISANKKR